MVARIFGREREIEKLQRLLRSENPEFLAIYGRRRVGKTYLIQEFFKDKGTFFSFTGTRNGTKRSQIQKFYRVLKQKFEISHTEKPPTSWDDALFTLQEAVGKIDPSKKVILFFDELPWLASKCSGFLEALEYFWNQYLSQARNVILIVCGSAANWIIKKIINNKGGLYGRLTEVIKLNAFTLDESMKFLQSQGVTLSHKLVAELYMCFGGVAKYLTYVHPGESAAQSINRLCFISQGPLVPEFTNLYYSLFDSPSKHIEIVRALAAKKGGVSKLELYEKLNMPTGGQSTAILEELEESGFIAINPEFQKKAKNKRLWLVDEYSYFYLSWIEEVKSGVLMGHDSEYWLKMQSEPRWKTWAGYAFESLCFKHIPQIKKALGISALLTTESQWAYKPKDKSEIGVQIDLLLDRKDDCINIFEIKFCNSLFAITKSYAKEIEAKIRVFREVTKTTKTIFITFITPFGLQKNEYSTELIHNELVLEDLFC
ncbi:MAG: AAA family ATPase [Verrucomicrobia bacterium]|nr:AAA family ATPase [Verrucomicrobiota bacterium]